MQFLVTAHDYADGYERRMAARGEHLENIARLMEGGHVVCAGGLTEDGKLVGSALVMEFADRSEVGEYLAGEPYVKANVWEKVTVEPMNVLIVNNEKVK